MHAQQIDILFDLLLVVFQFLLIIILYSACKLLMLWKIGHFTILILQLNSEPALETTIISNELIHNLLHLIDRAHHRRPCPLN